MTKEQTRIIFARCYVAMAEVNYDLREWTKLIGRKP